MNPRDAYLAWQADIGTEDVVLVQPWVKPRPAPANPPQETYGREGFYKSSTAPMFPAASTTPPDRPFSVPAGADFFQSIAASLAKPEPVRPSRSAASVAAVAASETPKASSASLFPEFRDLEAYKTFLETVYPQWFPGVSKALAHAQGPTRPLLAVVELFPSGEQVFGGPAGEFLDKMMKGIGLGREHLYLTSVMKTPPAGKAWARKDAAKMLPGFLRELELAGCGLVLLLGETCAQCVLRTGQGLAALAETAENHGNMTLVATEHPSVLMNSDDAARRAAWNQLKWLRARLPALNS